MDLPIYSLAVIGFGVLLALIGGLMLLIAAFRESILWGLIVIFAPCGNIIYCCVHWAEAKRGFLTNLAGTAIAIAGIFTIPGVLTAIQEGKWVATDSKKQQEQTRDLSTQIADQRKLLEDLQTAFATYGRDLPAEYKQLEKRRSALKPEDAAALARFNEDAAAYQSKNKRHRQIQQELNNAQAALDQLLDERSRSALRGRTAGAGAGAIGSKSVVMYTTQHCPACKVAKQYMAQKGIHYQEIDVESSRDGRAAFERLGGRGVPLIMVGEKRMEGFNSQELDRMLL